MFYVIYVIYVLLYSVAFLAVAYVLKVIFEFVGRISSIKINRDIQRSFEYSQIGFFEFRKILKKKSLAWIRDLSLYGAVVSCVDFQYREYEERELRKFKKENGYAFSIKKKIKTYDISWINSQEKFVNLVFENLFQEIVANFYFEYIFLKVRILKRRQDKKRKKDSFVKNKTEL